MTSNDNTLARSLHDLGLAGWFGGSLMGATSVNRAAGDLADDPSAGAAVNGVWRRWWLVNLACIVAHLVGGALLVGGNKARLAAQPEASNTAVAKTVLTAATVGVSAYSGLLGKKMSDAGDVAMADGTTPSDDTPAEVASAQRRLSALQWVLPVMTGALVVMAARQGEQQRPTNLVSDVLDRLNPAS